MRSPFDPARELEYAATMLGRHWMLALPTALASMALVGVIFAAVISLVVSILAGHAAGGAPGTAVGIGSGLALMAGFFVVALLVYAFAVAMTLFAAPDVLMDRPPNFALAARAALGHLGQFLLMAALGAVLTIALCATVVGIVLLPVLGYFLMYAPAAVVVGGESATQAFATSARIARDRVPESLVAWLGILAAYVVGTMTNAFLGHIPFLNLVAGFAVGGLTATYSELVRTRFYLALRIAGMPSTLTAPPPGPPNPPPVRGTSIV